MSRNLLLHTSRNLLLYTIKSFKMQGDLQLYNPVAFLSGGRELQSHFYLRPRAPGGLGAGCPLRYTWQIQRFKSCLPAFGARGTGYLLLSRSLHEQTIYRASCHALPLWPRKRPQRLVSLCGNDRWLRRPGPWPDAEAVTSDPFHRKS